MNGIWYVFTIVFVLYRFTTFFSFMYNFTRFCNRLYNGVTYCCGAAYHYLIGGNTVRDEESLLESSSSNRESLYEIASKYVKTTYVNVKKRLFKTNTRGNPYEQYEEGSASMNTLLQRSTQYTQTENLDIQYDRKYNGHYQSVSLFHPHDTSHIWNMYEDEEDLQASIFKSPAAKSMLSQQLNQQLNQKDSVDDNKEIKDLEKMLSSSVEVSKVIETELSKKKVHSPSKISTKFLKDPFESQIANIYYT
jgi:hypothetical protein